MAVKANCGSKDLKEQENFPIKLLGRNGNLSSDMTAKEVREGSAAMRVRWRTAASLQNQALRGKVLGKIGSQVCQEKLENKLLFLLLQEASSSLRQLWWSRVTGMLKSLRVIY